jgi:hypothetical protein
MGVRVGNQTDIAVVDAGCLQLVDHGRRIGIAVI